MINIDKIIRESIDEEIYNARNSVNTNPTEKQKKAGNYKKGHVTVNGFKISIENPKGSYRRGKTKNGKEWSVQMPHDYGYFVRTKGKDGDAIDVFIGDSLESEKIYVVDQKLHGTFDESKVMFCFDSIEDAKQGYMDSYEEGWKGFWKITPVSLPVFKKWLYDGRKQRKPFYDYVEIIKHNKKEKKKLKITENTLREIIRKYINESIINEGAPFIRNTINETSTNRKLASFVRSDDEINRLRNLIDNGEYTTEKNGKTVDTRNELERKKRQKETFGKGGARDIALKTDPNREYYQQRFDDLIEKRKKIINAYNASTDERKKGELKTTLDKLTDEISRLKDNTYGYRVYGDGKDHGYHIDTPDGKAYSTKHENNFVYGKTNAGTVDRLSRINDVTNAMMGYHDELNGTMDDELMDIQRRQRNVQALRDYEDDHKEWEREKDDKERNEYDYKHKPFYKKLFSKKPNTQLRPEPTSPKWERNKDGQYDGYFAHENPKDYDKDMENVRQRKQKYKNALNKFR